MTKTRKNSRAKHAAATALLLAGAASCGTTGVGNSGNGTGAASVPRAAAVSAAPEFHVATARPGTERNGATLARGIVGGKTVLYVADEDERILRAIDPENEEEISATPLAGRPGQLLVLADGSIAVAIRDQNRVDVIAPARSEGEPFAIKKSVAVASEPVALALTPDDATLLVASGWGRAVSFISVADFQLLATRPTDREPRAITVSADGKHAFIAHAVGGRLTTIDLAHDGAAKSKTLAASEESFGEWEGGVALEGRTAEQGYGFALGTGWLVGRIYLPQTLAFEGDPTVRSSGYGGDVQRLSPQVFNVAIIDGAKGTPLAPSLVLPGNSDLDLTDDGTVQPTPERRCLLPRGAAIHARELLVTCLGIDAVVALDATSVRPRQAELRRFSVAEGPTGIAVDSDTKRAFVWSQFSRAISVLDLADTTGSADSVHSVALPHHRSIAEDDEVVATGRRLFHGVGDRRVAKDGRACASCHPEGRDDGLVWSTPNGPRQTPMLAGRTVGTGPYSWLGDSETVADHLEHTIARLGGKGLPKSDREALAKYLAVMPEPPRSFSPESTEARERGAAIFASAEAGCSSCHGARGDDPDGMAHDVKSKASADRRREFDTPSLKFIGGTAPYFHDGRYPDLRTLLTKTNGRMGHTSHLSEQDFDALTAFLRTL